MASKSTESKSKATSTSTSKSKATSSKITLTSWKDRATKSVTQLRKEDGKVPFPFTNKEMTEQVWRTDGIDPVKVRDCVQKFYECCGTLGTAPRNVMVAPSIFEADAIARHLLGMSDHKREIKHKHDPKTGLTYVNLGLPPVEVVSAEHNYTSKTDILPVVTYLMRVTSNGLKVPEAANASHVYGSHTDSFMPHIMPECLRQSDKMLDSMVYGVANKTPVRHIVEAQMFCGGMVLAPTFTIIAERPEEIHVQHRTTRMGAWSEKGNPLPYDGQVRDNLVRLHSLDGPAVKFRCGRALFYIEGVQVPSKVVLQPDKLTIDDINGESNEEVKRIITERYGLERYITEVADEVLDQRKNEIDFCNEVLILYENKSRVALVTACCSTNKRFVLPVPRETRTCEAAQAWLFAQTGADRSGKPQRRIIGAS